MLRLYRRIIPQYSLKQLHQIGIQDTLWQHYSYLTNKHNQIHIPFYQRKRIIKGSDVTDLIHTTFDTFDNEQRRFHKHVWYFESDFIQYYQSENQNEIVCLARNWNIEPFKGKQDTYESYQMHLVNCIPVDSSESEIESWEAMLKTDWIPDEIDFNEMILNYDGSICPDTKKEILQKRLGWSSFEI